MTQLTAVALAALFLGIGLAGEPLEPWRALIAAALLALCLAAFGRRHTALVLFLVGFLGVIVTCVLQRGTAYPGTLIVALALGALAASSWGRKMAPAAIATLGAVIGSGLFFIGIPAGY